MTLDELYRLTASVEKLSEHPLAEAIVASAGSLNLVLAEPNEFLAVVGKGASAIVEGKKVLVGSPRFLQESQVDTLSVMEKIGTISLAARQ